MDINFCLFLAKIYYMVSEDWPHASLMNYFYDGLDSLWSLNVRELRELSAKCLLLSFWVKCCFPKQTKPNDWVLETFHGCHCRSVEVKVARISHGKTHRGSCTELLWFSSTHIHWQFAFHVQQLRSSITHWVIQLTVSSLPPMFSRHVAIHSRWC